MSKQGWVEQVENSKVDGPALTASITPTSILQAQDKKTFEPGFFEIGRMLRVVARGRVTTVVTTPGTLTLELRFGSIVIAGGGAMTLNIVAQASVGWDLDWLLTCRAEGNGTTANFHHQGRWHSHAVIGSPAPTAGGAGVHMLPYNLSPAVGAGFDSSVAQTLDLFATWSISNADSITVHQYSCEVLN